MVAVQNMLIMRFMVQKHSIECVPAKKLCPCSSRKTLVPAHAPHLVPALFRLSYCLLRFVVCFRRKLTLFCSPGGYFKWIINVMHLSLTYYSDNYTSHTIISTRWITTWLRLIKAILKIAVWWQYYKVFKWFFTRNVKLSV